jgi:hypothetical protein
MGGPGVGSTPGANLNGVTMSLAAAAPAVLAFFGTSFRPFVGGAGAAEVGAAIGDRSGNVPALISASMCASFRRSGSRRMAGLPRSAFTTPMSVPACFTRAATRSIAIGKP